MAKKKMKNIGLHSIMVVMQGYFIGLPFYSISLEEDNMI